MPSAESGVYVVVPAYNEESTIGAVVEDLRAAYANVLVVDDGATDGTHEVAKRAGAIVLRHVINRGQGAALQTGMRLALLRGAEYIVTFDADGQHRVEDIARLLEPIRAGQCDIALGSRFLSDESKVPAGRRLMLRCAVWFTRIVHRMPLTDAHNGLRAFSRRAAQRIDLKLDRMAHASELIDQIRASGLPFREVPVVVRYTPYSLQKGQRLRGAFRIVLHYLLGRVLR